MVKKIVFLIVWTIFAGYALCAENGPKTVRVGYYHSENFQDGGQGTPLYGYAYEYYQRVAQYTGWRYEYVFGSFDEIYDQFLKGNVDLMAGLAHSKEREQYMGFSKHPMGREVYQFIKRAGDRSLFGNPMSMQGKRIGVLGDGMDQSLRQFLAENQIQSQVIVYKNGTLCERALAQDSIDVAVVETRGLEVKSDFEVFFKMSNSFYYLCVTKKRPDLLVELHRALGQLVEDDPIITAKLFNKYVRPSSVSKNLSPMEKEWLAGHDTLKIGYLKGMLPYSDLLNEDNAPSVSSTKENMTVLGDLPTGIVSDIFLEMSRYLSVKKFVLKYTAYDSYDSLVASIARGGVDVGFPTGGNLYWAEKNGIYESSAVIRSEATLVFKGAFNESAFQTIAVNQRSRMMELLVREYFPNASVKLCDNVEECLNAVQEGTVSATIIGNLRSNHILKNRQYSNLSEKLLNIPNDKFLGVAIGNAPLLKLLNRGIALMGDDYALNLSYQYAERLYKPSLLDDLSNHIGAVIGISAGVFGTIFILLISWIRRAKKRAAKEFAQNERLSMQLDVIATISDLYHSVFLIDVNNNSFETIHTAGFIGNAIDPLRNDVQKALFLMAENMVREKYKAEMRDFNTISSWKNFLADKDSCSIEYEGNVFGWCRITILAARRDKDGIPTHVIYISQEINNQKKVEQELQNALDLAEQANNAKTFFLNNMSHDIRTPMNAIIGFTSLAADHIDDKERLRDYLAKINTSSEHLLSLINDVLDMRRIESGNVKLEEMDTNLPELLKDVQTIVQTNANLKHQDLLFDVKVNHENIVADRLRLNQVLLNLLSNAIKFTPDGGCVRMRVEEKPCDLTDSVCYEFRVKDNGIGMSPNFKDRIFDAFSREETSTVSGIQGTGLGMAITKNIVVMMGGNIQVVSEEGQGSEFIVNLQFKIGHSVEKCTTPERYSGLKI
ncbi:transporter substrate-binding domain-containing protein [Fibrobacter sp. UWEL]|uniref:ATP-binding protein n=1 Tax=Fibrobacter sp. UWEL TaxID=1896209 RepID=UPI0009103116|nr:transporter substrate-binding domain-containing protein [Fibrobacter sp. UWEL]SHL06606.1 Signal transduction histidine kinase [Fibrobacter sp. UWEL]